MTMLKARYALVVFTTLLLISTFAEAKGPPLPQPDPERGSIGVAIRAIPPAKFGKMTAVQVYFVRPAEGGDVLDAEFVISSNYSDKKQVYFLNAKPGCYVAVAARLKGSGMGLLYEAFFSMEMLPEMEVMVVPGKLVFMGEFLLNTSTKMGEADLVQSHFYRLMLPEAARQGFFGRTFSGKAPYTATLKSVDKGADTEREFSSLAEQKVFKNEPAWQDFVQMRLETSAKSCATQSADQNSTDKNLSLKHFRTSLPTSEWKLGYHAANNQEEILEYVPLNETVEKWTSIITEQYWPGFKGVPLLQWVSIVETQLRGSSKDFKWNVIQETDSSIVFAWSHKGSGTYPPTYTVTKAIVLDEKLYSLAFSTYTEVIDTERIILWETHIKNAALRR